MISDGRRRRRVYRSVSTTRSAVGLTVSGIAAGVVAAIQGTGQIFFAAWAVLFLAWAWRQWNLGVHLEVGGVRVVGFWRSVAVPWESIDRFDVSPHGRYPFAGYVILNSGRQPILIMAIGSAARPKSRLEHFRRQVQRPVDELNQVLAERRESTG